MVALYCVLNFLFTYWFISEVLPTDESPTMTTFNNTFLRPDMIGFVESSTGFLAASIRLDARWISVNDSESPGWAADVEWNAVSTDAYLGSGGCRVGGLGDSTSFVVVYPISTPRRPINESSQEHPISKDDAF